MTSRPLSLVLSMVLALATGLATARPAHAEPAPPPVMEQVAANTAPRVTAPAAATADDAARYGARERLAGEQAQYQGGQVVIIGVSTLALILIIVLIVVLA